MAEPVHSILDAYITESDNTSTWQQNRLEKYNAIGAYTPAHIKRFIADLTLKNFRKPSKKKTQQHRVKEYISIVDFLANQGINKNSESFKTIMDLWSEVDMPYVTTSPDLGETLEASIQGQYRLGRNYPEDPDTAITKTDTPNAPFVLIDELAGHGKDYADKSSFQRKLLNRIAKEEYDKAKLTGENRYETPGYGEHRSHFILSPPYLEEYSRSRAKDADNELLQMLEYIRQSQ